MISIVGFTADADTWCVDCAIAHYGDGIMKNGSVLVLDGEGNEVHPLFSTDESGDTPDSCGDCCALIDTSWSPSAVDYAIDRIAEAIETRRRNDVLDTWAEHVRWCGITSTDRYILDMYTKSSKH